MSFLARNKFSTKNMNMFFVKRTFKNSIVFDDLLGHLTKIIEDTCVFQCFWAREFHYVVQEKYKKQQELKFECLEKLGNTYNRVTKVVADHGSEFSG